MHLTHFTPLALAGLAASVSATKLYVSSYTGDIHILNLTHTANSSYNLGQISTSRGCGDNATWLELDHKHHNLFCLDEGIETGNGSLTSFKINKDGDKTGSLTKVTHTAIPNAPVNSVLLNGHNGTQLLAVAHYAWALTTYVVDPLTAALIPYQSFNFTQAAPGPLANRQKAPHPHQVLLDPFGKYLVIPDLGSDLLRIFYFNRSSLTINERPSVPVAKGSGPRHGVFEPIKTAPVVIPATPQGSTHSHLRVLRRHDTHNQNSLAAAAATATPPALKPSGFVKIKATVRYHLVSELASSLSTYTLTYLPHNSGLNFTLLSTQPATGPSTDPVFSGNAPAEIHVARTKCGETQLIVSNRNATFFKDAKNPNSANKTGIASDTLATFSFAKNSTTTKPNTNGKATFTNLTPAGGLFPRHFSLSPSANLVAVGLQNSGRVVVYPRDVASGKIGDVAVADFEGLGGVTGVFWGGDEEEGCRHGDY
ncbi:MAG: hypothetical protein LQ350_007386 [Teloschistes chrysophthalmus]|nr:MAG: hypothetical protein LQ350_007386 [Niorma chrysophthalma]